MLTGVEQTNTNVEGAVWSARVLANEARLPMLQALHSLQYARFEGDMSATKQAEEALIYAMDLCEQFVATGELFTRQAALELEPLAIGSILENAAHNTFALTKRYGVQLKVDVPKSHQPILAHRQWTSALFEHLASLMVYMGQTELTLGAHSTLKGIKAGIYTPNLRPAQVLAQVQHMAGGATQAITSAHSGSTHVLIADAIGQSLHLPIGSSRHARLPGIGVTIPWSGQLTLGLT